MQLQSYIQITTKIYIPMALYFVCACLQSKLSVHKLCTQTLCIMYYMTFFATCHKVGLVFMIVNHFCLVYNAGSSNNNVNLRHVTIEHSILPKGRNIKDIHTWNQLLSIIILRNHDSRSVGARVTGNSTSVTKDSPTTCACSNRCRIGL